MCGIIGILGGDASEDVLSLLVHRGPDSNGLTRRLIAGRPVFLGHTRLAIQDLSEAGHQPMSTSDGRFTLVFNGEIYNHLDLRKRLRFRDFSGHSDTETILYYLAEKGIEAITDLNGIFTFCLLDAELGMMYVARDPFGVKPLYYHRSDSRFVFASEIAPMREVGVAANFSPQLLGVFLRLRYYPAPLTPYSDIRKVRPGELIKIGIASNSLTATTFAASGSESFKGSSTDALEAYEYHLRAAVDRQLLSDVPISLLLSGGVDSALLAKFALEKSCDPIASYTAGYEGKTDVDEVCDARSTAQLLGTDHHEVILSEDSFAETLPKLVAMVEEPLGSQSIFPIFFLSRAIHEDGFKVTLTGQGVDEPWGGYRRYNWQRVADVLSPAIPSGISRLLPRLGSESFRRAIRSLGKQSMSDRLLETYSIFDKSMIEGVLGVQNDECANRCREIIEGKLDELVPRGASGTEAMMLLDVRMGLADDLLLYTDKMSMAHSLEVRVPYLDLDLVRFVESLPLEYRVTAFGNKLLHKELANKFLPSEIVHRKKKGFYTPRRQWFMGETGRRFEDALSTSGTPFAELIAAAGVHELFKTHRSGRANFEKQLYLLIALFFWMEEYVA